MADSARYLPAWQGRTVGGAAGAARGLQTVPGSAGGALYDSDGNVEYNDGDWGGAAYGSDDEDGADGGGEDQIKTDREFLREHEEDYLAGYETLQQSTEARRAEDKAACEALLVATFCPKCHCTNLSSYERRAVTLLRPTYTVDIDVPIYTCHLCMHQFHVQPAAIGAFPSTTALARKLHVRRSGPPLLWFGQDLLELVYLLQHRSPQLAVKAFSEALSMMVGVKLGAKRIEGLLGKSLERYRAFAYRQRRAATLGCHDYPPERGAVGVCPARCHHAGTPDAHGNIRPLPDIQFDACMGLRRRADAAPKANAARTEPLVVERCLPVNARDGGQLFPGVRGIFRGAKEWCADIETKKAAKPCTACSNCNQFRAGADTSGKRRRHDQTGFFAAVCNHGFFLFGAFMHEGEKYAYAAMLLLLLAQIHFCGVERVWYDIGPCQFKPYWGKLRDQLPEEVQQQFAATVFPLLPFHRHMHTAACQAVNAAHFFKGAGLSFGEVVERKWSRAGELALRLVASGIAMIHIILECFWQLENELQDVRTHPTCRSYPSARSAAVPHSHVTSRACAAFTGESSCTAGFLDGAGARAARRYADAAAKYFGHD